MSWLDTVLQYPHDMPSDYYGVDLLDVRTAIANVIDDLTALHGCQIELHGERSESGPIGVEYPQRRDYGRQWPKSSPGASRRQSISTVFRGVPAYTRAFNSKVIGIADRKTTTARIPNAARRPAVSPT